MNTYAKRISASIVLIVSSIQPAFAAQNVWQMTRLFHPGAAQLERENNGHVMIYHGMKASDVHRAMDEQFERIEAMMFTGTIETDDEGEPLRDPETNLVIVEDDGC